METEDTDRNRFVLDVTKTEFLKEGFTISRVGGSTASGAGGAGGFAGGAGGFAVPKEKGAAGKRSSSRPSSGKVRELDRSDQVKPDQIRSNRISSVG